ncbi:MAG TPA: helix-turn-helix transcriptional regulator [Candidatus Blautia ornithocaccae]|nr:hypothetical protein B5G00_03105 [Blautia sp. An46]HJD37442.1 helix-turn-helix transcriptional regulator [Candidatus Blautia ornithocaccae]
MFPLLKGDFSFILFQINPSGKHYFSLVYKNFYNRTVDQEQQDFRIRRACSLLKETELPISDIARSVGYDNALYFSRLFRQKKGRTPTQYRKGKNT